MRSRDRALPTPPIGKGTHVSVTRLSKSSVALLLLGKIVGKIRLARDVRNSNVIVSSQTILAEPALSLPGREERTGTPAARPISAASATTQPAQPDEPEFWRTQVDCFESCLLVLPMELKLSHVKRMGIGQPPVCPYLVLAPCSDGARGPSY